MSLVWTFLIASTYTMIIAYYGHTHVGPGAVLVGPLNWFISTCLAAGYIPILIKGLSEKKELDGTHYMNLVDPQEATTFFLLQVLITIGCIFFFFAILIMSLFMTIFWLLFIGWWLSIVMIILESSMAFQGKVFGWGISFGMLRVKYLPIEGEVTEGQHQMYALVETSACAVVGRAEQVLPCPYGMLA